jgi:hypothetical protein
MTFASMLAITWNPEIRGIIAVLVGFVVLCGSVYLILSTNLGGRLGFLVAIAGLAGWLATMGLIWWVYGIGLKGPDPSWKPLGQIVNDGDLYAGEILQAPVVADNYDALAAGNSKALIADGWSQLAEDDPARGQAIAASDDIIQNQAQLMKAGEYTSIAVYDKGGEKYPLIANNGSLDMFAFRHTPHYALVEVRGVLPNISEPGRAPATPTVDPSQPPRYVLMERDLGARRQPAVALTLGGGLIFLILCWLMHRRDRVVAAHRSQAIERAPAGT